MIIIKYAPEAANEEEDFVATPDPFVIGCDLLIEIDPGSGSPQAFRMTLLVGNLNAYIGAEIGKTGYVRQRDLEFSQKNISQQRLVKMIEDTITVVADALGKLNEDDLEKNILCLYLLKKLQPAIFLYTWLFI